MRGSLSFLERLCVQSFLDAGHHVALYGYGEIGGVPDGVERRDAGAVLEERAEIVHGKSGSPAPHADLFRYRLLAERERTIWADTDAYCLRPFAPEAGHFYGYESPGEVNNGVLALPRDSEALGRLVAFTADEYAVPYFLDAAYVAALEAAREAGTPVHVGDQVWGVWGPWALTNFLNETGEIRHALPQVALYPYGFADRRRLWQPGRDHDGTVTGQTLSIHLYGRRMRKRLAEREKGLPHPESLIGQLLIRHGIDPAEAPLPDCPEVDCDHPFARIYRAAAAHRRGGPPRGGWRAGLGREEAPPAPEAQALVGLPIPLRRDPPETGAAAYRRFVGLMERNRQRRPLLELPVRSARSETVVAVTSMKNEGAFILEWVAYHLSIGVGHFLVYTNDCDDPTEAILDRLEELGVATRLDNPFDGAAGQKPQRGALNDAERHERVRGADWVGVFDVDEFVNIHVGDGSFGALVGAARDPNVISMTWRFFGNRGVHRYDDKWQTEALTACAPFYLPKPRLGWGFKSFYRPDGPFGRIGVHRPLELDPERAGEVRWVNGSGRAMPERAHASKEWFSRKNSIGYDLVTLNHYVLRSAESFLVKRDRGRINHVDQDQGLAYWMTRNYASETETAIHARLPAARGVHRRLMADPGLAALHAEAVAWHRARIAALMAAPEYRALYAAITDPTLPDAIWRGQARVAAE